MAENFRPAPAGAWVAKGVLCRWGRYLNAGPARVVRPGAAAVGVALCRALWGGGPAWRVYAAGPVEGGPSAGGHEGQRWVKYSHIGLR